MLMWNLLWVASRIGFLCLSIKLNSPLKRSCSTCLLKPKTGGKENMENSQPKRLNGSMRILVKCKILQTICKMHSMELSGSRGKHFADGLQNVLGSAEGCF